MKARPRSLANPAHPTAEIRPTPLLSDGTGEVGIRAHFAEPRAQTLFRLTQYKVAQEAPKVLPSTRPKETS
jgi:hypothetical protein